MIARAASGSGALALDTKAGHVAVSLGLLDDPAVGRLATLMHYLDAGGIPVDEAPGLELVLRGLQARHAADDPLLAAAIPVFDALYAALQVPDDH